LDRRDHDELRTIPLTQPSQTNEIGRSAVLMPGAEIARRTGLPQGVQPTTQKIAFVLVMVRCR